MVDRYNSKGFCNLNNEIRIALAKPFFYEEPPISGTKGSGAIFFSGCNLKCCFCQNMEISKYNKGQVISIKRLAEIMLELQEKGVHNINLVTPTIYVPQIVNNLHLLKDKLTIPIVYNTSSYENVNTIKLLDGLVDIYLADFKYFDNSLGEKYSNCKNYFDIASKSIDEMYKQVKEVKIENNLMKKGLIVRLLVLPGEVEDSIKILDYLYNKYGDNIIISIMNQYTPIERYKYSNLNRKVSDDEYSLVVNHAYDLGIRNSFIQEGDTQEESFIPNFDVSIL